MPTDKIGRRGLMLILSSPSGAGKTSIAHQILEEDPNLVLSVSVTTRPPRHGEVDGVDYHFVSSDKFEQMHRSNEFLESATVFGNRYGTPRGPVEKLLGAGRDILFDIDWQGTQQLTANAGKDLASIFILPPSTQELGARLRSRAQDSKEAVAHRMSKAADEMSHWPEYDYVIVNRDLDKSVAGVRAILMAERLRRDRRVGLAEFVKGLREG
jgi:guanylate kinase